MSIASDIALKSAELEKVRAAAAAKADVQERHEAAIATQQRIAAEAQGEVVRLRASADAVSRDASQALRLVEQHEEELLALLTVVEAGAILDAHRSDPVGRSAEVIARVERLRRCAPSELHWPINRKFSIHPLIVEALKLVPEPNELDSPLAHFRYDRPMVRKSAIVAFTAE